MSKRTFLLTIFVTILFFSFTNQAVDAARFYFNPASGNIGSNCNTQLVNLMIDTEGADTNAADIEITFNSNDITIVDQDTGTPGIQVNTGGSSYQLFVGNSVTGNKILLTGYMDTGVFNGDGIFAQIAFAAQQDVGTANFNIRFDGVGESLDSNVSDALTNADLLTSVTNASYSMTIDCATPVTPPPPPVTPPVIPPVVTVDATKPQVTMITPPPGNSNVDVNTDIKIQVIDPGSGVNLTSVVIVIDNITYTFDSPGVTYEETSGGYIFTINPSEPFDHDQIVSVNVTAEDNKGNKADNNFSFRTSKPDIVDSLPPSINLTTPDPQSPAVPSDSTFIINLTDVGTGVDLDTLVITYLGKDYTILSPEITFEGNMFDYVITFRPGGTTSFDPFTLKVKVTDFSGNEANKTFTFNLNNFGALVYLINFFSQPTTGSLFLITLLLLSIILWFGFPGIFLLPLIIAGRIIALHVETLDARRKRISFVGVLMRNDKRSHTKLTNLAGFARFFVPKGEYIISAEKNNLAKLEFNYSINDRNLLLQLFMQPGINSTNVSSLSKWKTVLGQLLHLLSPIIFIVGFALALLFILISQEIISLFVLASYLVTFLLWIITRRKEIVEIR